MKKDLENVEVLFLFINDLRFKHNEALQHALSTYNKVRAAYNFYKPSLRKYGPRRNQFLLDNLKDLSQQLALRSINLETFETISSSDAVSTIIKFIEKKKIAKVYLNSPVDVDDEALVIKLESALKNKSCDLDIFLDQTMFSYGQLLKKDGTPYKVFTPFFNHARDVLFDNPQLLRSVSKALNTKSSKKAKTIKAPSWLKLLPYDEKLFRPGEKAAIAKLKKFLLRDVKKYHINRDLFAEDKTSGLSPYLAIGSISIKTCFKELLHAYPSEVKSKVTGPFLFMKELFWREFYRYIWHFFPILKNDQPFIEATKNISWNHNESDFKKWIKGQTGFPIVDAAMRKLELTGQMHNRLRMVVASFLTKNLLINWQKGESYFLKTLLDADQPSNNGGWQWSASTGCDAQPYFRIFNPILQSQRFDPKAQFIAQVLPELADVGEKYRHRPSQYFSAQELLRLGYPQEICDLKHSAEWAKEQFSRALKK